MPACYIISESNFWFEQIEAAYEIFLSCYETDILFEEFFSLWNFYIFLKSRVSLSTIDLLFAS